MQYKKRLNIFLKLLAGLGLSALLYQNCGRGFYRQKILVDYSSLKTLAGSFDFIFDAKIANSVAIDQYGRVESIDSAGNESASLHPPFSGSSTRLNLEAAPLLQSQSLNFTPDFNLELSRYDIDKTYSENYTIGITISGLNFVGSTDVIRLLDVIPPESVDFNGQIFLQAERYLENGIAKYRFLAGIWYGPNLTTLRYFNIPAENLRNKFFIMLVVPTQAKGFRLIINGVEHLGDQQGPSITIGALPNLPQNVRSIVIHGYSRGKFNLHSLYFGTQAFAQNEVVQFHKGIAKREGINLSGTSFGEQTSDDGNRMTFADLTSSGSRAVFTNSCIGCHSNTSVQGGLNLQNYTQSAAKISTIIDRMDGRGNIMPTSGMLPSSQIDLVKKWRDQGTPQ